MLPKVSIIIPIFNRSESLQKCLESICNQTLREIEIICVDDGSTDDSFKIVSEFTDKDKRFIGVQLSHSGTGIARNKGVEIAKGEYLGFVDADDYVDADYFEKLYNQAMRDKADICCALERKDIYVDKEIDTITPKSDDLEFMKKQLIFTAGHLWSKIFRTDFIKKNNIKNSLTRRTQDIAFSIPAILKAEKINYVNDCCYYYQIREDSASHQPILRQDCEELAMIFKEILSHNYKNKEFAQKIISARLNTIIQSYLSATNRKEKIIIFKNLIKNIPNFLWNGTNIMAYRIAKLITLLGL